MTERKILAHLGAVTIEEEITFETDPASSPVRIRLARNIAAKLGQTMIPVEGQKSSDMRGPDPQVVAGKSGTIAFEVPLFTVDATESPIIAILKRMGMELRSTTASAGTVTGGTSTTIEMADADAATAGLDAAVAANIGKAVHHDSAAGTNSVRFVESIAEATGTTTITVNGAFTSTPVSGDGVLAMDVVIPKGGDPDKTFSINAYLGEGSTNRLKLQCTGCAGTWKLVSVGPKNLPAIAFEFQISKWVKSEASLAQTDAAGNRPRSILGAIMLVDGVAMKTRVVEFDPGITVEEIESFNENGRQGWNHADSVPVLGFTPLHDIDWITKWEDETTFDWMIQRIYGDTDAWALWCPEVQVVDHDTEEAAKLLHSKMAFQICDPETNADDAEIPLYAFAMSR